MVCNLSRGSQCSTCNQNMLTPGKLKGKKMD